MIKPETPKTVELHPGMMGDGTEEQNLNQPGAPALRITEGRSVRPHRRG